jgi:hypothetical protein
MNLKQSHSHGLKLEMDLAEVLGQFEWHYPSYSIFWLVFFIVDLKDRYVIHNLFFHSKKSGEWMVLIQDAARSEKGVKIPPHVQR